MSAIKKVAFGLWLLFTITGAMQYAIAQVVPGNSSTSSVQASDVKKSKLTEARNCAAIIAEGVEARKYSSDYKDIFVLQVIGGKKGIEAYTAKQYAESLQKEFAKHGQQVAVYYREFVNIPEPTFVGIYKDQFIYDIESETFVPSSSYHRNDSLSYYHPSLLHKEIPKIVKNYSGTLNTARIIKGHRDEASYYSIKNNDIFVLHVSGGTKGINGEVKEAYPAVGYAELLQKEFAKYGEQVAVFYEESGKDWPTGVQIAKYGFWYDRTDGAWVATSEKTVFHPFILHGKIPKIIKEHTNIFFVSYDAFRHSTENRDVFVLFISGGTKGINGEVQEAYNAKQYGDLLQKEFAKHGEQVAVFYEESGKDRPTGLLVLKDGRLYDRTRGSFDIRRYKEPIIYHPFILYHDIQKIVKNHKGIIPH